jgi:hypothetical protein
MATPPVPPVGPVPLPPDDVELLKKYRDIVMPAARLAGYDDFAKWLFTLTAVIGTLGAAFSNAALKGLNGYGVTFFFLAVMATALSLALAVIQRSIDIPKLNWHSLDDMLQKTERALRIKRTMAWFAGALFAAAIILAGLAPLLTTPPHQSLSNSISYSFGKDGVHVTAILGPLRGVESELDIVAQSESGQTLIAAQRSAPDSNDGVKLDVTSVSIPNGTIALNVVLRCNANASEEHILTVPFDKSHPIAGGKKTLPTDNSQFVVCKQ